MSINLEEVPAARTIRMVNGPLGLMGQTPMRVMVGESVLFALDYKGDLACNQKIASMISTEIVTGTPDGLTIELGRMNAKAKFNVMATAADTYIVRVIASYAGRDRAGLVRVIAT